MIADGLGVVVMTMAFFGAMALFVHLGAMETKVRAPDLTNAPPRVSQLRRKPAKFAGATEQEALRRMRDDMRERVARKSTG
jgi:hypothetical protein